MIFTIRPNWLWRTWVKRIAALHALRQISHAIAVAIALRVVVTCILRIVDAITVVININIVDLAIFVKVTYANSYAGNASI